MCTANASSNPVSRLQSNLWKMFDSVAVDADGRVGLEEHGPYDAIHVGAAARELPQKVNPATDER